MTEVVLLVSSLIFADLRGGAGENAAAHALLCETKRFDAVVNYASAFPNSERPETVYLTILIDKDAEEFAEIVRGLDGVYSSYVKPDAELP
ncbi:MAG: hypothetical protein GY798_32735 [Hyphomicrobiales bacterium]|nr:hypothetical protein [Hyphomicrobiales bacterium]